MPSPKRQIRELQQALDAARAAYAALDERVSALEDKASAPRPQARK